MTPPTTPLKEVLLSLARRPSLPASLIPRVMRVAVTIRDADERSEVTKAFDVQLRSRQREQRLARWKAATAVAAFQRLMPSRRW